MHCCVTEVQIPWTPQVCENSHSLHEIIQKDVFVEKLLLVSLFPFLEVKHYLSRSLWHSGPLTVTPSSSLWRHCRKWPLYFEKQKWAWVSFPWPLLCPEFWCHGMIRDWIRRECAFLAHTRDVNSMKIALSRLNSEPLHHFSSNTTYLFLKIFVKRKHLFFSLLR